MTVPLDRLYNFLDNKVNHDMVIYRWMPHGSRKIEECKWLNDYKFPYAHRNPIMLCHDQEPLNFDDISQRLWNKIHDRDPALKSWHLLNHFILNIHDSYLLLHSERNSHEVEKFKQNHAQPVYYWSHALIARDWFRYANRDPILKHTQQSFEKDFLIYSRAWAGNREYRLKFMEQLIHNDLVSKCLTTFNAYDSYHYREHVYKNSDFCVGIDNLEEHFDLNQTPSTFSADFTADDYQQCGMEVVLETLFDDQRNHLTEKTLRPIACGKPFILASSAHSLDYLRSYGFQTFHPLIDESYDQETDSLQRLMMIINELKRISQLNNKSTLWRELHDITKYNQTRFFSKEFHDQVVMEYECNLSQAIEKVKTQCQGQHMKQRYSVSKNKLRLQAEYEVCVDYLKSIEERDPSHVSPGGLVS